MESNTATNSSQSSVAANQILPSKKSNLLLILIVILLLTILGVVVFVAYKLLQSDFSSKNINPPKVNKTKAITITEDDKKQAESYTASIKRIAYVKGNGIWVINSDATGNSTVAAPEPNTYFPSLSWKNQKDLTYVKCATSCAIYTKDALSVTPSKEILEVNPGENTGNTQILTVAWNHAGNQLAYIYKLPDGQMRMDFKSGAIKNVVKTFASLTAGQGGRGGSLDDSVSIYFSPDDKNVLVTNTIGQPTVNDRSTIWVFDSSGKETNNLKSEGNTWKTQAGWGDSGDVFYKSGNSLYRIDHADQKEKVIFSLNGFFNTIHLDSGPYYYWVNTQEMPYLGVYDYFPESRSFESKKIIDNYFRPQHLEGTNNLIALKAIKVPKDQEAMFPYVSGGLSKIDLRNNKVVDLDSGDINLFAVSP